jgi:hypothetical protein
VNRQAAVFVVVKRDARAMQLGDVAHDGQAQAS